MISNRWVGPLPIFLQETKQFKKERKKERKGERKNRKSFLEVKITISWVNKRPLPAQLLLHPHSLVDPFPFSPFSFSAAMTKDWKLPSEFEKARLRCLFPLFENSDLRVKESTAAASNLGAFCDLLLIFERFQGRCKREYCWILRGREVAEEEEDSVRDTKVCERGANANDNVSWFVQKMGLGMIRCRGSKSWFVHWELGPTSRFWSL